jgi:hypothetical protein
MSQNTKQTNITREEAQGFRLMGNFAFESGTLYSFVSLDQILISFSFNFLFFKMEVVIFFLWSWLWY